MKRFEYFEATADIGFKAYGKTMDEAFENAGLAIFNIISDTDDIEPSTEISFEYPKRNFTVTGFSVDFMVGKDVLFSFIRMYQLKVAEILSDFMLFPRSIIGALRKPQHLLT